MGIIINRFSYILIVLIGLIISSEIDVSQSTVIISNITKEDLDFGFCSADYNFTSPFEVRINSKNEWDLYIQPYDLNLISLESQIPIQKIQWKRSIEHESNYKQLNYDKTWIASSQQDNNGIIELDFRIKLNWMTPPGEYSLPVEIIFEDRLRASKKKKLIKATNSR